MHFLCVITCLSLALFGCAPKAIPVAPLAPIAKQVAALAKESSASAKRVTESAVNAESSSVALGFQISEFLAAADKQRTDDRIPDDVAEFNFQMATRMAAMSVEAERRAKVVKTEAVEAEKVTVKVAEATETLVSAAAKSDQSHVEKDAKIEKLAPAAAKWSVVVWSFWGLVAAAVAFAVFKILRKTSIL